jgi:CHAT domain-containing protein
VHAAGIYVGENQECCSDYVVSSYTPTVTALLRAKQDPRTYVPAQIKFLGVAAERAADASMPRLHHVSREVRETTGALLAAGVSSSTDLSFAPSTDIRSALRAANMVHFACHGIQHGSDPHKSRFCLSAGDLSVAELMNMDLKDVFFAFLSACETAKGDPKHADEAVHLAATMLFAGFKSVVATMWWVRRRRICVARPADGA